MTSLQKVASLFDKAESIDEDKPLPSDSDNDPQVN